MSAKRLSLEGVDTRQYVSKDVGPRRGEDYEILLLGWRTKHKGIETSP